MAEAGDLTRFESPTQLMSYFGLTPSEYSSGENATRARALKLATALAAGRWWKPPSITA